MQCTESFVKIDRGEIIKYKNGQKKRENNGKSSKIYDECGKTQETTENPLFHPSDRSSLEPTYSASTYNNTNQYPCYLCFCLNWLLSWKCKKSCTYCFAFQIVYAAMHKNAIAQMRCHIDNAARLIKIREWFMCGRFFAIFNFILFGCVGEWWWKFLPEIFWKRIKWIPFTWLHNCNKKKWREEKQENFSYWEYVEANFTVKEALDYDKTKEVEERRVGWGGNRVDMWIKTKWNEYNDVAIPFHADQINR